MLRKIEDFERMWAYESSSTAKVFDNLTDASLAQKVSENGRTLGYLAWHIVLTLGEMPKHVGLTVDCPAEDTPVPATAKEIGDTYKKAANSVAAEVSANWNDETLLQEDEMYGETWKRGFTLQALISHQNHHRGQMTVLMRQAGLTVPGVYGPAKEEWSQFGMDPLP